MLIYVMQIISKSLEDTASLAGEVLVKLKAKGVERAVAVVVGLSGDLGSGKTTFSQSIAHLLGVQDAVTSPTFIIEKLYTCSDQVFPRFVHIDAYRLEKAEELEVLGFKELCEEKGILIFIEWPERVAAILPEDTLTMNFKFIDQTTRSVDFDF